MHNCQHLIGVKWPLLTKIRVSKRQSCLISSPFFPESKQTKKAILGFNSKYRSFLPLPKGQILLLLKNYSISSALMVSSYFAKIMLWIRSLVLELIG